MQTDGGQRRRQTHGASKDEPRTIGSAVRLDWLSRTPASSKAMSRFGTARSDTDVGHGDGNWMDTMTHAYMHLYN